MVRRAATQETARQAAPGAALEEQPLAVASPANADVSAGRTSEVREAVRGLREDYAAGRITEAEFDAALNAILEAEGLAGEEMLGGKYSIDENYERDIDAWDSQGRPEGEVFILGTTGDVLQGLGAMEQDIYLRSEKVNAILEQHPEMTVAEIKRIPEILDDPVLVLKSLGAGARTENTRLVLFGTVRAENGQPVLTVLDVRPVENGLVIDNMQKVNSAYTKDKGAANFVQRSEVLYADKKRTAPLLRSIGLTIASRPLLRSGSVGSITYQNGTVNLQGKPFSEVVRTQQGATEGRYSFGGVDADEIAAFAEDADVDFEEDARYNGQTNEGGVNHGREVDHRGIRGRGTGADSGERTAQGTRGGRVSAAGGAQARFRVHTGGSEQNFLIEDSEGRRLTEELAGRLDGTAIVDASGKPLAVYHFTPEMDFETFEKGDIGFHFGTQQQAARRGQDLKAEQGRVFRAHLNIHNPVQFRLDLNAWWPSHTGLYLWSEGYLTDAEWSEIQGYDGYGYDTPGAKRLREILKSKGYDAIAYPKGVEGAGDSYIAFEDAQIIKTDILPVKEQFSITEPVE